LVHRPRLEVVPSTDVACGLQSRLANLLATATVSVVDFDADAARVSGVLLGRAGTSGVIDASVAVCARMRGHIVVTSDPDDLHRLDPRLAVVTI
jgi:predicted nucleic acid-binding protein